MSEIDTLTGINLDRVKDLYCSYGYNYTMMQTAKILNISISELRQLLIRNKIYKNKKDSREGDKSYNFNFLS